MLGPTAHIDTFSRDNLPKKSEQPDFLLSDYHYPDFLNASEELTDVMVGKGFGDNTALIGNGRRRTYKELTDWTNKLANALVENYGVQPGNRVLIRSANNPAMVACWLAATKVGAVVVNTMPMLRSGELDKIIDKAKISYALCDSRLLLELNNSFKKSKYLKYLIPFDGTANHSSELDEAALEKSVKFESVKTGRDDVALLGFTSGTTGEPKATMHFHRDLMIIADGYAKEVLQVDDKDIFVGSPPLAFTFGLGGLAIFPLRYGATATLLEDASPPNMIKIIQHYFTPTVQIIDNKYITNIKCSLWVKHDDIYVFLQNYSPTTHTKAKSAEETNLLSFDVLYHDYTNYIRAKSTVEKIDFFTVSKHFFETYLTIKLAPYIKFDKFVSSTWILHP